MGYLDSSTDFTTKDVGKNLVNININIDLGNKAKIKKISFVGNKVFKDRKLRRIIASSEYRFWKFLTGRKFLNENLVKFDKDYFNFYKNNGFYNVEINSSFAKLVNKMNLN